MDGEFLLIAKKNDLGYPRLGLAVAKKKIALAANRNKVKRLIRESFRHHQDILQGIDVVVIVQKKRNIIDRKKILSSIKTHWKKIARCGKP